MKPPRHRTAAAPAARQAASFVLHPLSVACLVALAGPAHALPTGGTVVGGQATIGKPTPTLQVVTQNSSKAVIDWTSFSIASGETVRFDQPSSSAVLLNRVTGYDPSAIFGQMQSNGRIFLLNPYGVVFGASARVDVGGLVASSLSLSTADFMAGRFSLSSSGDASAPTQRGEVRNEGTISAPGGVVVLAGPVVSNTGTIEATGGRVGLAAAQEALVDVEGDGLIFFRTTGTAAGNRLAQLGRIQADGGSVELRAAARGAFADTVLNMSGVVQARSLGMKEGRVVIDGGDTGITRVAGTVDASGAAPGEHGGQVSVRGQKVLLDLEAVLNASGDAGGGKVTVGGDWQGQSASAELGANAQMAHVAGGALIDVHATTSGRGGTAVVWSDEATRFYGTIDARGGASGGDGGQVEVSGKRYLDYDGSARIGAAAGTGGSLLLDPADITISTAASDASMSAATPFQTTTTATSNLNVGTLVTALNGGGTIHVNSGTGTGGAPGSITLASGANIAPSGNGSLQFETDGAVVLNSAVTLNGGSFTVLGAGGAGRAASFTSSAAAAITTTSSATGGASGDVSITTSGDITLGAAINTAGRDGGVAQVGGAGGNVTLSSADGSITAQSITTSGGTSPQSGGPAAANRVGGKAGDVTLSVTAAAADRAIDVQGSILAVGGSGGDGAGNNAAGGAGGAGGAVSITSSRGSVSVHAIDTSGGAGGTGDHAVGGLGGGGQAITLTAAGSGNDTTVAGALASRGGAGGGADSDAAGAGGSGGVVMVTSGAGAVALGTSSVHTGGGLGGSGTGNGSSNGAAGANRDITISAGTDFAVSSVLDTTGGTGNQMITLQVGHAHGGGTLTIDDPSRLLAGSVTIAGGGGTDRLVVTLPAGNSSLIRTSAVPDTLTLTGLPPASVSSIETSSVTGSAGNNAIDVSGFGGAVTIAISSGTDTVTGAAANNVALLGPAGGPTWTLTAANTGSVGGTAFSGVGSLSAGGGNDTFRLNTGVASFNGTIDGGTGNSTLALTDGSNTIALGGLNSGTLNTSTVFTHIATIAGGSGTDTLTGPATGTTFTITAARAVNVAGIDATSIDALVGGAGADTFRLETGVPSFVGSIDGGGGSNTLAVSSGTNTFALGATDGGALNGTTVFTNIGTLAGEGGSNTLSVVSDVADLQLNSGSLERTGLNTINFSGIGAASVQGGAGANTIVIAGTFAGDVTVQATAGADFVTGHGARTTLAGTNASSVFDLGAGTLTEAGVPANATHFSNVGRLVGGSGTNTLVLTDSDNAIALSGPGAGTVNGTTTFAHIAAISGGSGNDTLTGPNGGATFNVVGANAVSVAGIDATSIEALEGGTGGSNSLVLGNVGNAITIGGSANTGTLNGTMSFRGITSIVGGIGTDTITGPSGDTDWTITGAHAVTIGGIAASSVEALVGGAGADRFTLAPNVASFNGSIDGGAGSNTLATSNGSNVFAIGGSDSGTLNATTAFSHIGSLAGGANDTLDLSARPGALVVHQGGAVTEDGASLVGAFSVGTIVGNGTSTDLVGPDAGQTFTLAGDRAGIAGALAFSGVTHLSGGTGTDTLVVANDVATIALTGTTISRTGFAPIGLSGFDAAALSGGAGNNTISVGNDFAGNVTVRASAGIDTVAGTGTRTTLVGTNTGSLFTVTGGDAVTLVQGLDVTTATGVGNLAGGAGNDTFAIQNAGTLSGGIDGGAGTNRLDLSQKASATIVLNLNQGSNSITGAGVSGTISNITTTIGNGLNTTLQGSDSGQSFVISADNEITVDAAQVFQGVGNLRAGQGNDSIDDAAGHALAGSIVDPHGAVTLSGTIRTAGGQTYGGPVTATSLTLSAGGDISAVDAGNQFTGALSLTTTGAAGVDLTAANALTLGTVQLGSGSTTIRAGSSLSRTAPIAAVNAPSLIVGNQAVDGGVRNMFTTGAATSVSIAAGAGATHDLTATGVSLLPSLTVSGNLTLQSSTQVTQSGPVSVAGTTNIQAGAGSITLTNSANDFQGAVSLSGGTTQITDANALTLGALATGPLTATSTGPLNLGQGTIVGTLVATSHDGPVSQSGSLTVNGTSTVNAGAGSITLTHSANDFQGAVSLTGGTTQITDINALTLGNLATGTLEATGTGALTLGQGTTGGALVATSHGGPVSQSGALTVAGTSTVNAGTGSITLTNALNDFQGAVSLTGGTTQITDANTLTLGTLATGALTASGSGALDLGQGRVDGNLLASSHGGAISQSGALTVVGTSSVDAGTGSITLVAAANDFQGAISLSGGATQIADANALTLGTLATGALDASSNGALNLGQGNVGGSLAATSRSAGVFQSGALQVNGDTRLTGQSVDLGGSLAGARDLLLQADTLTVAGTISGTGTLAIEPLTVSRSIGVAGAAGDLQVSQGLLANTSGFTAHRIGRADGSGDIAVDALQLRADTTLQTGSGKLDVDGSIDGPFALALNSGGTTRIGASLGVTSALRSLTTDNNAGAADWNGSAGEHTLIDVPGGARIVTTGAQTFSDPLRVAGNIRFEGGTITATQTGNEIGGTIAASAAQLNLTSRTPIVLGDVTLSDGGRVETAETLELAGALRLSGGTLSLVANGQPTALADFTDPELAGQGGRLSSGAKEASATIFQGQNGTVATTAGSLLVLRSPAGGSILLNNEPDAAHPVRHNDLLGGISAVSGVLGGSATTDTLGFVRIASTEIHAAGAPPADANQSLLAAGIEGDVLWLSADKITTGATGQLRARLPYSNVLGARDSIPGLTLTMSPTALTIGGGFGLATPDGYIQVRVGNEFGGFVTVRPRGATGQNAFILLAGPEPRPFYDLNGKANEVRLFYNGDAPRTPQETGALSALMAIVEDARQTRFEEAVRTENVKSRLRSGVIAEVGAGRPATVGRESIRLPSSCNPKETSLQCE